MRSRNVLDGFFTAASTPSPTAALAVLQAVAALQRPDAAGGAVSQGRITSAGFVARIHGRLRAERGGIACEILFGPLSDLACRCGKYTGAEHAGTVCEKCGVLCGDSALRAERFAHLELPGGVVHPALSPLIGELCGLTAEDVRAVAGNQAWIDGNQVVPIPAESAEFLDHTSEMGVRALRARLATLPSTRLPAELSAAGYSFADLFVAAVPVLPPGDRPLLRLADPTVLAPQAGPLNEAYRTLAARALRLGRLCELAAPEIILLNEEGLVQRAFDRLYEAVIHGREDHSSELPPKRPGWHAAPPPAAAPDLAPRTPIDSDHWAYPFRGGPPDPALPCGCLVLDDDRLLLQFPYVVLIVSRGERRVLAEHAVFGLTARSTDATGRRVVFLAEHPSLTETGALGGVAVLDTRSGEWLKQYPEDLRAVTVVNDQPEDAFLHDYRSGENQALDIASDRPGLCAVSADHRFLWAGGGGASGAIVNTDTAIVHLEVEEASFDPSDGPFLRRSGALIDELPDEASDAEDEAGAAAVTLTADGRFRLLREDGAVFDNDRKLYSLAFPRLAAAFDRSGAQLLVLGPKQALISTVAEPPVIAQRIELSPLRGLLRLPAVGLSAKKRDALLQRVGTLRGLGAASDAQLAELRIGKTALDKLRKAAAALPAVLQLR